MTDAAALFPRRAGLLEGLPATRAEAEELKSARERQSTMDDLVAVALESATDLTRASNPMGVIEGHLF